MMNNRSRPTTGIDYPLLFVVIVMVIFGLMMIYSATFTWPNSGRYLMKQALAATLGLAMAVVLSRLDYRLWRHWALPVMGFSVALLILVLLVGKGSAASWFSTGSFQPSEFAKLAFIIYIAAWLASKGEQIRDVTYGLVPFAILLGIVTGLIVLEPDLGTAVLVVATAVAMFFIAGAEISQLFIGGLAGGAALYVIIVKLGYANERLQNFLHQGADLQTGNYHVQSILIALRSGGLLGRGLGNGVLKLTLPLPHTDSIFPVIGEELGLLGCLAVVALFLFVAYRGMSISYHAPDPFSSLLAFGVTCWIVFQALVHIAVSTAIMPYTGITLPFISYGGSSLVMCLAGVGVLLAISRMRIERGLGTSKALTIGRRDRRPRLSRTRRGGRMEKRDGR
jgi:cell division protein FtsW